jgi:hypothetical protein
MRPLGSLEWIRGPQAKMGIHQHNCFSCGDPLTCCCPDKRQIDRATGKQRKILCDFCAELERQLKEFYGDKFVELEKVN